MHISKQLCWSQKSPLPDCLLPSQSACHSRWHKNCPVSLAVAILSRSLKSPLPSAFLGCVQLQWLDSWTANRPYLWFLVPEWDTPNRRGAPGYGCICSRTAKHWIPELPGTFCYPHWNKSPKCHPRSCFQGRAPAVRSVGMQIQSLAEWIPAWTPLSTHEKRGLKGRGLGYCKYFPK